MTEANPPTRRSPVSASAICLPNATRAVGPPLLFGMRLWGSVCLTLCVAFWLQLDNPYWGSATFSFEERAKRGVGIRARLAWQRAECWAGRGHSHGCCLTMILKQTLCDIKPNIN